MAVSAWGLVAVFITAVVMPLMPPQPWLPAWQLRLGSLIVNQAPLALLAHILLHTAALLQPAAGWISRYRTRWRLWAAAAALGFLLLIPLQAAAILSGLSSARAEQSSRAAAAQRRFEILRRTIASAPDLATLQARLQALQGPDLTPADRALPLPQLRRQLDAALVDASTSVQTRLRWPSSQQLWAILQDSVRLPLSSLAFALAFAAGGQRPSDRHSLLRTLLKTMSMLGTRSRGRRRSRSAAEPTPRS